MNTKSSDQKRKAVFGQKLGTFYYKINQQDVTVFRVFYSTFICDSTCFGRRTAHHQEHTTAPAVSGFAYVAG
jgi:hypothetical protein